MLESTKSHFDLYVELCVHLLSADPLGAESQRSLLKDCDVVRHRVSQEGLSFLTKSLPKLGKSLDAALETGKLYLPSSFRACHGKRGIPAFMQGYFSLVFDGSSGELLETPCADAIQHLRQVLFCFYKLELPYSSSQESKVISDFLQTEEDLQQLELGHVQDLLDVAASLAVEVMSDFDPDCIDPRHGPGAVSTGERLDEKWTFGRLYTSIHQRYPYWQYYLPGDQVWNTEELCEQIRAMQVLDEGTAKVVLVPKDSRGPRLISAEPLEYQWIQQGLGRKLMSYLESNKLTGGFINFTSQEINQRMAFNSSIDRQFATLDLKEASDRVSLDLVERLFSGLPKFLSAIKATRSSSTRLPDGKIVKLLKCSPMGSAVCFPLEALVFWLLVVAARQLKLGLPFNDAVRDVYVYGDDIVVPTTFAHHAIQSLESCGLLVNRQKCCIQGFFRESCGVDAFKGVNVTPFRVRTLWSGQRSDGNAFVSYTAYMNNLHKRGYTQASGYLRTRIEEVYGKLPYGTPTTSFPCIHVDDPFLAEVLNLDIGIRIRTNASLQQEEFRVLTTLPRKVRTSLDGLQRLLRNLSTGVGPDPSKVVVPRSTRIKRGWASI